MTKRVFGWINIYRNEFPVETLYTANCVVYPTREEAMEQINTSTRYVETVPVFFVDERA